MMEYKQFTAPVTYVVTKLQGYITFEVFSQSSLQKKCYPAT